MSRVRPGSPAPLGATLSAQGANFAVFSQYATGIDLCLFDARGERETARTPLPERTGSVFHGFVEGVTAGTRYGLRAHGPWAPHEGHRFDHTKLLVIDREWVLFGSSNWDPRSLRLNFELDVECHDPRLAAEMDDLVASKIASGRRVTLEEVDARPLPVRLGHALARLLSPYL